MVVAGDGVAQVCGVCEEDWELSGIGNRAPVNWCVGEYVTYSGAYPPSLRRPKSSVTN